MTDDDRRLGMDRPIQRRDFLQGAAVTALGLGAAAAAQAAPQEGGGYYPPWLTGMRGSHPGSFEAAHRLRDGSFWQSAPPPEAGEDVYDLVVVGGGISGLAAAHFYGAARPGARILVLENHDDVGGHAKRNEFVLGGRTQLMNGGTADIDSPYAYSRIADGLLRELGVSPVALEKRGTHKDFYPGLGLSKAAFFARERFGADFLASGIGHRRWSELLAGAPLSAQGRGDIARVEEGHDDLMPGLSSDAKKARLSRMSYRDYLVHVAKVGPEALAYYQDLSLDWWGVGIDAVSALDIWALDYPGFAGLKLSPGSAPHMGYTAAGYANGGSYTFHFPDGNASIVRLLVRKLVPGALPGNTPEDAVTSRLDYARLDRAGQAARIRLSSIVVGVRNLGGAERSQGVEVAYTRFGQLARVRARDCVLACYNMMIPYLCPEMPAAQKTALHYLVKIPMVYTTVALANWRALQKLGVWQVYAPGSFHCLMELNPVVDIGEYRSVRSPDEPILVRLTRVPCHPGLDERSQHRIGRADLLATTFETFERRTRDQLGRMLTGGGFDPARDILGITVNRWPHGYAYEYNPLFDPEWPPGQAPHEIGRARFGRIVVANSDSGAAAYTNIAIDEAHRAVNEALA